MALDRQSIEKKDFPVGRRGYDPEAVDAHLSALAGEVAELRRSSRRRSDTLASSASDQVRQIVEAAETSAAEIQREAEADAREIRDEANSEAQSTRQQATDQAREYVGQVSQSTDTMVTRLDSMQSELDTLIETLRTGSTRLSADLKLLQTNLTEVGGVVSPRPSFEPEEPVAPPPAPAYEPPAYEPPAYEQPAYESTAYGQPAAEPELAPAAPGDLPLPGDGEPVAATEALSGAEPDAPAVAAASAGAGNGHGASDEDAEGARLIALNMALNGTPREETARYLEENFALADAGGLLDEVYASVEG